MEAEDFNTETNGMTDNLENGDASVNRPGSRPRSSRTRVDRSDGVVMKLIENAVNSGANVLDLSGRSLKRLPEELLQLSNLEYLYLEGNELTCLPDEFFDQLPYLQWLDLRNNYITHLPSVYLGRHQCLRTMLLEGNELKSLPLELGLVSSLTGLNISNNPLEFPPLEVIEMGTKQLLAYLRELLYAKTQGKHLHTDILELKQLQLNTSSTGSSGGSSNDSTPRDSSPSHKRYGHLAPIRPSSASSHTVSTPDLVGPVPHSASLHKPASYDEIKKMQMEKIRKVLEKQELKSFKKKTKKQQINYPSPPTVDKVHERAHDDRRKAKQRELNEKQHLILQRRRDQETLKQWRQDSQKLQQKKYIDSLRNGKIDFIEPASQAPYGIAQEDMTVMTKEEKIQLEIKNTHEKMRRVMTPNTQKRIEQQKQVRERELQNKIKMHAHDMQERRKKPKGNPHEEMEAAKRELAIVKSLQSDLLKRYQDLKSWSPSNL